MTGNQTVYYTPLPPKPATLLILERGNPVRIEKLSGDMRLGRDDPNTHSDIRLHSAIVSRNHGDFAYIDGTYYYKDNNSLNGTFLNGQKLQPYNDRGTKSIALHDGDVLRIDRRTLDNPHPEAVEMIFSTVFSPDEQWQRYSLQGKNSVTIGRSETDIRLPDFMVSRHHATLKRSGNTWSICDQGSTNGIAVNKEAIEGKQALRPFDVIRIANTTLIFTGEEMIYNEVQSGSETAGTIRCADRSVIMSVNIAQVYTTGLFAKKKVLLRDINLDIESGDFILVLGGAGAGKSTLIKAITGQKVQEHLEVDGTVILDGMDLYKKRNLHLLKHKIGIVPQYPDYRPDDTVYHTIMDSALLQLSSDYSKQEISQRVESVIQSMMLGSIRDSKLAVISGGQRKRVQVAIKAVGDISFFTFDEPDAGLDVAGRKDQINQLTVPITKHDSEDNTIELKQATATGTAGLMISHYPDDVAEKYTKVIVLAKSRTDDAGHLAYYGDVPHALEFFGVTKLSEIVLEINYEGGKGRGDEFIKKFEQTRSGEHV